VSLGEALGVLGCSLVAGIFMSIGWVLSVINTLAF
jgi:hypothetical protein